MLNDLNTWYLFLFAGCRMTGVIFLNPIFGRGSVPALVKIGLSLGIALHVVNSLAGNDVSDYTTIDLLISMLREFAVGFAMGFIMQLFLAVFHIGGELMDLQLGISMAQMYDPATNSQVSVTGNLITAMYVMLFFITNSHITMLAVAVKSYAVVPVGLGGISGKIGIYVIELFGFILVYALQLALPIIVTEILAEVGVGILMRVVPNINVFVVNIQLKVLVGLVVLLSIIPVLVRFLGKLNQIMLDRMQDVLAYFI
jgi:flagellar biosynthetic protein FliR